MLKKLLMKTIVFVLFIILNSFVSNAHEYFFSFAEMEYNDVTRKFEITITATTHDIEKLYEKQINEKIDLTLYDKDSKTSELISTYFSKHFQLKTENANCILHLIGYESSLNGVTNFYLESDPIDITPTLTLMNDVLMDEYSQQQNKITLYYQSKSYTTDFLRNEHVKTIILN